MNNSPPLPGVLTSKCPRCESVLAIPCEGSADGAEAFGICRACARALLADLTGRCVEIEPDARAGE